MPFNLTKPFPVRSSVVHDQQKKLVIPPSRSSLFYIIGHYRGNSAYASRCSIIRLCKIAVEQRIANKVVKVKNRLVCYCHTYQPDCSRPPDSHLFFLLPVSPVRIFNAFRKSVLSIQQKTTSKIDSKRF